MADQALSQDEVLANMLQYAAVSIAEGKSKKKVVNEFVNDGVPEEVAEEVVRRANDYKKAEFRKAGIKTLLIGVGFLVAGGVITAVTYSAASGGGTYVVTTGLFLVGAINVLRGLFRMASG